MRVSYDDSKYAKTKAEPTKGAKISTLFIKMFRDAPRKGPTSASFKTDEDPVDLGLTTEVTAVKIGHARFKMSSLATLSGTATHQTIN